MPVAGSETPGDMSANSKRMHQVAFDDILANVVIACTPIEWRP
jgi:hypothetical protein